MSGAGPPPAGGAFAPVAIEERPPPGRRRRRLLAAVVVVVVAAAVVLAVLDPFGGGRGSPGGVTDNGYATSLQRVTERALTSQTQVSGTLGFAGESTIRVPAGIAPSAAGQARGAVAADRRGLASAGSSLAADHVALANAGATLAADEQRLAVDCAGDNAAQNASSSGRERRRRVRRRRAARVRRPQAETQAAAGVAADECRVSSAEHPLARRARAALERAAQATAYGPDSTFTGCRRRGASSAAASACSRSTAQPVLLLYGLDGRDARVRGRDVAGRRRRGAEREPRRARLRARSRRRRVHRARPRPRSGRLQAAHGEPQTGQLLLGSVVFEPRRRSASRRWRRPSRSARRVTAGPRAVGHLDHAAGLDPARRRARGPGQGRRPGRRSRCRTTDDARADHATSARSRPPARTGPTIAVDAVPTDPAATGNLDQAPVQRVDHDRQRRATRSSCRSTRCWRSRAAATRSRRSARRRAPPRGGDHRPVRRRRRPRAGQRRRARGRAARRGAGLMSVAAEHRAGGTVRPVARARGDGDGASVLELDAVTKTYPALPPVVALAAVSFSVRRGELVAIVGPSGSGKSTLLHVMGTLERPSAGAVRITGLDVAGLDDRALSVVRATRIGFVFQQFFLAEHQSVLDNVADGLLYAGVAGVASAASTQRARSSGSGSRTAPASGRRSCRAASASASRSRARWSAQPAIVLADEPTGNLDSANGAAIFALLQELHAAGTTIVVITHDRELAARLPRQIEMLDGRIVADTAAPATARRVGDRRAAADRAEAATCTQERHADARSRDRCSWRRGCAAAVVAGARSARPPARRARRPLGADGRHRRQRRARLAIRRTS